MLAHSGKIALQSDGKLVIAGSIGTFFGPIAAAAFRVNTNGTADSTFGTNGVAKILLYQTSAANDLAIAPSGKIVLSVTSSDAQAAVTEPPLGLGNQPAVVQLTTKGAVDTTFGTNGRVINDVTGKIGQLNAVITQPDGKILAAGWTEDPQNGGEDFMILRFNTNGMLDSSFGVGGIAVIDIANQADQAHAIALQSTGKIIVAGEANVSPLPNNVPESAAIIRLNSNGTLDTSFGTNGRVVLPSANDFNSMSALAINPDDSIVFSFQNLVQKLTADGKVDSTFGTKGVVSFGPDTTVSQIIPTVGNKLLLAVENDSNQGWVERLNSNGSTDSTFGTNGQINNLLGPILGAANGAFIFATEQSVSQHLPNGSLDPSFGTGGQTLLPPPPSSDNSIFPVQLTYAPDGKIVLLSSFVTHSHVDNQFAVLRLNANGTIDTSFAGGNYSLTANPANGDAFENPTGVAVEPDDSIIAVGDLQAYQWGVAKFLGSTTSGGGSGTHLISGTGGNNTIILQRDANDPTQLDVSIEPTGTPASFAKIPVTFSAVDIQPGAGDDTVQILSLPAGITKVTVEDPSGNNRIDVSGVAAGVSVSVTASTGNDTIIGGAANATLNGGAGNDSIVGGSGSESILGGDGNDSIFSGQGNDTMHGGSGNDTLMGGTGADQFYGDGGTDTADFSNRGLSLNISLDDIANDGPRNQVGGLDNVHSDIEIVIGGAGNDSIVGDPFDNELIGGAGNDTIFGGSGNDTLEGDAGNDQLYGQDGNDTLLGQDGQMDTLDGGNGTDTAQRDNTSSVKDLVLNVEAFD